jgi:thioredoxin reductase
MYYDIVIIGSGIAGLYSAYNIIKKSKNISFIILEKEPENLNGGRTNNDIFYGTKINTGAGIGRVDKNPLLINLMKECKISISKFDSIINYSTTFEHVDIIKIINYLKKQYKKNLEYHNLNFKNFFIKMIDLNTYKNFIISTGYTDYENADLYETLYNYGFDDTVSGWKGFNVPWKELVDTLYNKIGKNNFKFNKNVIKINKLKDNPCLFEIITDKGIIYNCNKILIATTINSVQKIIIGGNSRNSIYKQIHGQSFLRLYGKFDKKSTDIMRKYILNYTVVPGPLQKIIPINEEKGVYMIAYSDNKNAYLLKNNLENNLKNRKLYCTLIEEAVNIPKDSLKLIGIKGYFWNIGTHYYEPLSNEFSSRDEFVKKVQHPEKGILVVGEAVSRYQGWVEGALESVETVLTKKWIINQC